MAASDLPFSPGTHSTDMADHRGIARTLNVLRLLAASQEQGLRAIDVAAGLGLGYTTAHRMLRSLLKEKAVETTADGKRYCIGPEISLLGLARTGHFPLRSLAHESMLRVRAASGESCFLTVRSNLDSVCIHRETGTQWRKVLSIDVGSRRPMGVVIGSIAYLACLPGHEARAVVAANRHRYAGHALDEAGVWRRIADCQEAGHAYAEKGLRPGTRSIGVAVIDGAGAPVASLSIVTVQDRLDAHRRLELVALLHEESRAVTRRMAADALGGWTSLNPRAYTALQTAPGSGLK